MFRNSMRILSGKLVIIEDDHATAQLLRAAVEGEGATVVGIADTVDEAMALISELSPTQAIIHIRYVAMTSVDIAAEFREQGVETIFLACFDDWFEFSDEDPGEPASMSANFDKRVAQV